MIEYVEIVIDDTFAAKNVSFNTLIISNLSRQGIIE